MPIINKFVIVGVLHHLIWVAYNIARVSERMKNLQKYKSINFVAEMLMVNPDKLTSISKLMMLDLGW